MTETLKKLGQGTVDTSVEAVYTVPALTTAIVFRVVVTNNTAGAVTGITLYHDGTGDANCLIPGIDLAAGEMLIWDDPISMEAADTLQLKSLTGDDVAGYTIYGIEYA